MPENSFRFKQFDISQDKCGMKVNTDGVLLGAWVDVEGSNRILDIGTGTGVIAIMIAQKAIAEKIVGVEIDKDSYEEAIFNMAASPWSGILSAVHMPVQEFDLANNGTFDLIVSNPPFFSGGTFSSNQSRALVKHTIKLSHGDLLRSVCSLLAKTGAFSLILPYIEGLRFIELAGQYDLHLNKICEVRSYKESPIERLLITLTRKKETVEIKELYIRDSIREYSSQYINLTKEYYLNM